jgi:hypothetical protein
MRQIGADDYVASARTREATRLGEIRLARELALDDVRGLRPLVASPFPEA